MGPNPSVQKENGIEIHQRFGRVKIQEAQDPQTHQQFDTMQLSQSVESQKQLQLWLKQISKIDDSETRQVLILPLKHRFQKSGMCGSTGIVYLTYEKYSFILENQIENRHQLKKFFIETQMWYMLYNMIRAANKFQRVKLKIGDIHPGNILINDDGQVKLISTCSLLNQHTNYDKLIENISAPVFLAPQEINQSSITKGQYPNVDPCKAQIFSIGLTLLSAGTLQKCDKVYQKNPYRINKQRIQGLLDILSQRYSILLTQTIANMLYENPTTRKRGSEIYQMLYPYQNQILDLQPFGLPTKITTQSPLNQGQSPLNQGQIYQPSYNKSYVPPNKIDNTNYRPVQTNYYPVQNMSQPQQYTTGNQFAGNQFSGKQFSGQPYLNAMGKY